MSRIDLTAPVHCPVDVPTIVDFGPIATTIRSRRPSDVIVGACWYDENGWTIEYVDYEGFKSLSLSPSSFTLK